MILGKKAFLVSFDLERMQGLVKEHLGERHWKKFDLGEITLSYAPYYVFNFDAFLESDQGGKSVVSDHDSGTMAMNAVSGELSDEVAELAEENEIAFVKSPGEGISFEVEKPSYSAEEVKRIAPLRIASKLGIGKEGVIASGFELAYLPEWVAKVKLEGEEYDLRVNAVSGEVISEEEIPFRQKGWGEVTKETLSDLKHPRGWVSHSRRLASTTHGAVYHPKAKNAFQSFLENREFQLALLVLIAILIVMQLLGIMRLP